MQESKCLECRIPAECMDEQTFSGLCERFDALGHAHEIDVESGLSSHVAWFDAARVSAPDLYDHVMALGLDTERLQCRILEEQDWATSWQKNWQALPIGRRLWIRPSFCEPAPSGRLDIVLDPGMAFGTGTHPTTRLCLEAIESLCSSHRTNNMLDMGAGSGILAIAALKLGASRADAVDMASEAVDACRANALINGVRLNAWQHDKPPAGRYDLVVANILANPLLDMAESLSACADGTLILSGLLQEQGNAICQAYEKHGLRRSEMHELDGWACLVLTRKK